MLLTTQCLCLRSLKRSLICSRAIRATLPDEFPGSIFYFQTADIVSQVLNFGLPAPIDIQIQDTNFERAYGLGQQLLGKLKADATFKSVPILMVTTEGSQAKVLQALELGANGYVRKPFTAEQIKEKLTGII